MPVTRTDVAWCYRSILGRDPESETALQKHTAAEDFRELVMRFIRSVEFSQRSKPPVSVPLDRPAMHVEVDAAPEELRQLSDRIREAWTHMGATRPHHSVLSGKNYLPENINQKTIEQFKASGARDALIMRSILERHNIAPSHSQTCVEYGCGLGRVTIPMSKMFKRIEAYDISSTHLAAAETNAIDAGANNIKFNLSPAEAAPVLAACDVFYSRIVFQHNPPPIMRELIASALRSLRAGGIAIFQVPTYALGYSFRVKDYLEKDQPLDMEMHCIPQKDVFSLIAEAGCRVLEVDEDNAIGRIGSWISNMFVVRRPV